MIIVRLWLYRGLIAVAAALMVTAAIKPWWTAEISHEYYYPPLIEVHQWGIGSYTHTQFLIPEEVTPLYQNILAWIYIAAGVGLILWSTWLRGRKGQLLLGGIGLINIAYAAIAIIWIAIRAGEEYGVPLQGVAFALPRTLQQEWGSEVFTNVRLGYYLAHIAGFMCIVLALLRNRITKGSLNKPKRIQNSDQLAVF